MRRAYKFRLYPTKAQVAKMAETLETHRRLYNAALEQRRIAYREHGIALLYYHQSADFKDAFHSDEYLKKINYTSAQQTLRRVEKTFRAFFRRLKAGEKPGYPRFKSQKRFDSVDYMAGDGARLRDGRTYFQHVGWIKTKVHRPIEGTVKTLTFRREAGQWFVILSCDLGAIEVPPSRLPAVGFDLGLSVFLTTSDNQTVIPPRFHRKAQAKLRRTQRALDRCQLRSKRQSKAKRRLQRAHQKIANQRRDWHHKTALSLVRQYGTIVHEDLSIKGIARSRLAKSTHDAGWGQFLRILANKAEEAGCRVVAISPRNTTQACSECGGLPDVSLRLKDRVYHCLHCGFSCDRDLNAALNIKRLGSSRQALTPAIVGVV